MDYKDDSSATELQSMEPVSKPEPTLLEDQRGDMEELGHLPPLPVGDIYAIPATQEPQSVHEPRETFTYKVRTFTNYSLAFSLFFLANFAMGVLVATLLWSGDMEPMLDYVKELIRSLK